MNWGWKIVVAFIAFAAIIFTMVGISMNQEINLVAEDYYKQEIEYEDQIQRIRNSRSLEKEPLISLDRSLGEVIIKFPEELANRVQDGHVHLFRPSDSSLDKRYKLQLDEEGEQHISVVEKKRGLWKIKLFWNDTHMEFYQEKILTF